MKAIRLSEFKLNATIARNLAEQIWGKGGTQTKKTNTKGIYYYSCSSHGGYVVDGKIFPNRIKKLLDNFYYSNDLDILVQNRNGIDYVIGYSSPFATRCRRFRYPSCYDYPEWKKYPIYLFEEDCNWALLEWFRFPYFKWEYSKKLPAERDELILKTIKNSHYKLYEYVTGKSLNPGESHRKDEDLKRVA